MLRDIFDSLIQEDSFIDGRLRESWVENSSLEKSFITRTPSKRTIDMAI